MVGRQDMKSVAVCLLLGARERKTPNASSPATEGNYASRIHLAFEQRQVFENSADVVLRSNDGGLAERIKDGLLRR